MKCIKCSTEFDPSTNPGALVFGPTTWTPMADLCEKYHLCQRCWNTLWTWLVGENVTITYGNSADGEELPVSEFDEPHRFYRENLPA